MASDKQDLKTFYFYEGTLDDDCSLSHVKMFGKLEGTLKNHGLTGRVEVSAAGRDFFDLHEGARMYFGCGASALYAWKRVCCTPSGEMKSYEPDSYDNYAQVSVIHSPDTCDQLLSKLEHLAKEYPARRNAKSMPL